MANDKPTKKAAASKPAPKAVKPKAVEAEPRELKGVSLDMVRKPAT